MNIVLTSDAKIEITPSFCTIYDFRGGKKFSVDIVKQEWSLPEYLLTPFHIIEDSIEISQIRIYTKYESLGNLQEIRDKVKKCGARGVTICIERDVTNLHYFIDGGKIKFSEKNA